MDVEATLAMKEARARTIQMEKEELIQEVCDPNLISTVSISNTRERRIRAKQIR